jgi:uncharacterized membrane protein
VIYAVLKTVHLMSVIVWIGGMVFSHFFLRPALGPLEPAVRLRLVHDVLGRFFRAVLAVSVLAVASGVAMLAGLARPGEAAGGSFQMPWAWWVMAVGGLLMLAIFLQIRLAWYPRLSRAVSAADWPAGGAALGLIRQGVAINLGLGSVILLVVLLCGPG